LAFFLFGNLEKIDYNLLGPKSANPIEENKNFVGPHDINDVHAMGLSALYQVKNNWL
jgi:hypothetical protein